MGGIGGEDFLDVRGGGQSTGLGERGGGGWGGGWDAFAEGGDTGAGKEIAGVVGAGPGVHA